MKWGNTTASSKNKPSMYIYTKNIDIFRHSRRGTWNIHTYDCIWCEKWWRSFKLVEETDCLKPVLEELVGCTCIYSRPVISLTMHGFRAYKEKLHVILKQYFACMRSRVSRTVATLNQYGVWYGFYEMIRKKANFYLPCIQEHSLASPTDIKRLP